MTVRNIRKAIGLFVIDIVIIIGIFILQFRTDSSIIEKIGNLQITMMKTEETQSAAAEEQPPLKNQLQASYNGFNLHIDEQTSAKALLKGQSEPVLVQLTNWERNENKFTFFFSQNIKLIMEVTSPEADGPLSVTAVLPKNVKFFYIPYNFAYNMKIQKDEGNHVILDGKKLSWNFKTEEVKDGFIVFDSNATAYYSVYDTTQKFTFDSITELVSADEAVYKKTIYAFKNNLISAFKTALSENNFTEQAAVSYVAAMAENGNYQQAIDDIPKDYKKSDTRTYLSAPYFDSLSSMNKILDKKIDESNDVIKHAAESGSLNLFTTHNIAEHLCIYSDSSAVTKILNNAVNTDVSELSISHVTGIIQAFIGLSSTNTEYAKILQPKIADCLDKIASACSYANNVLTISENDTFLSVTQAIETGVTVLRYGELTNNETYIKAGRVLVNSYLQEGTASFDLRTLSNLYPLLAYDNWYYPHFTVIHKEGSNLMWAWTCAKTIKYEKDPETGLSLLIDFPEGYTHYVIFKGIPSFKTIYIYNMAFRTDPRFEAYNSSGYVYKTDTGTLLLKSRHKSKIETIRMTYTEKTEKAAPVPTASTSSITGTGEKAASGTKPASENETSEKTESTQSPAQTASPAQNTASPAATTSPAAVNTVPAADTTTSPAASLAPAGKTYSVVLTQVTSIRTIIPLLKDLRNGDASIGAQALQNLPVTVLSGVSESVADSAVAKINAMGGTAIKQ